ncbi:hypothetical protein PINS_up016426 [Pythium insidiosum]|nr:hypothetical protein PINS_up016426 [Pythium insidiosum]
MAGNGSNEVVSMLHAFALRKGIYTNDREQELPSRTLPAFLVDSGRLRAANLHFLIKGHTKNNCDRGFALIKKMYAKTDD